MRYITQHYELLSKKYYQNYESSIEKLANSAFNTVILPWLKKHNYCMLVGNGTYYIYYMKNGRDVMIDANMKDDMPEYIREVLQLEVEHRGNGDLGCWMPDYNPKEVT